MVEEVKSVRHSAQELKQFFLDNAEPLVKEYIDAALGKGELQSTNAGAREEVWQLLAHLMKQSSEKIDINIESAEDVIKAVTQGKCTMLEGEQLLKLYKIARDIETSGQIGQIGGGGGGLTINILSATQPQEIEAEVIEHVENK